MYGQHHEDAWPSLRVRLLDHVPLHCISQKRIRSVTVLNFMSLSNAKSILKAKYRKLKSQVLCYFHQWSG